MITEDFDLKTASLQDDEKARLLLCMMRYENSGAETELPGNERFLWPVFKLEIDREKEKREEDKERQQKTSERCRKAAEARWGNAAPCDTMQNDADACTCINEQCTEMQPHADASACITAPETEEKEKRTKKEKEEGVGEEINPTPPKPPAKKAEEGFAVFWAAYPRKDAKKDAMRAWEKIRPDGKTIQAMLLAIQAQRASPQWQKDGGQFIPLPATWLNGRRWEDQGTGRPPGKAVSAQQYEQRDYTEEELGAVGGDLIAEARSQRAVM